MIGKLHSPLLPSLPRPASPTERATAPRASVSFWRDCVRPQEHGSWSLAFEPLVVALLVAPSRPGALLAVALAAGFFCRRPLRLLARERQAERRGIAGRAVGVCSAVGLTAFAAVLLTSGPAWFAWMIPSAVAGVAFAGFDCRGAGREGGAEIAGAVAFAVTPAAFGQLAGWTSAEAAALALVVLGRSVPAVMMVRAFLRAAKTGVRSDGPALVTTALAVVAAAGLFERGLVPFFAYAAMIGFAVRTLALLVIVRPELRARTLGMIEGGLGLAFVLGLALTWSR